MAIKLKWALCLFSLSGYTLWAAPPSHVSKIAQGHSVGATVINPNDILGTNSFGDQATHEKYLAFVLQEIMKREDSNSKVLNPAEAQKKYPSLYQIIGQIQSQLGSRYNRPPFNQTDSGVNVDFQFAGVYLIESNHITKAMAFPVITEHPSGPRPVVGYGIGFSTEMLEKVFATNSGPEAIKIITGIIAHEMGHISPHKRESITQTDSEKKIKKDVDEGLKIADQQSPGWIPTVDQIFNGKGISAQAEELRADYVGNTLIIESGLDPGSMPSAMNILFHLHEHENTRMVEAYTSTHPDDAVRASSARMAALAKTLEHGLPPRFQIASATGPVLTELHQMRSAVSPLERLHGVVEKAIGIEGAPTREALQEIQCGLDESYRHLNLYGTRSGTLPPEELKFQTTYLNLLVFQHSKKVYHLPQCPNHPLSEKMRYSLVSKLSLFKDASFQEIVKNKLISSGIFPSHSTLESWKNSKSESWVRWMLGNDNSASSWLALLPEEARLDLFLHCKESQAPQITCPPNLASINFYSLNIPLWFNSIEKIHQINEHRRQSGELTIDLPDDLASFEFLKGRTWTDYVAAHPESRKPLEALAREVWASRAHYAEKELLIAQFYKTLPWSTLQEILSIPKKEFEREMTDSLLHKLKDKKINGDLNELLILGGAQSPDWNPRYRPWDTPEFYRSLDPNTNLEKYRLITLTNGVYSKRLFVDDLLSRYKHLNERSPAEAQQVAKQIAKEWYSSVHDTFTRHFNSHGGDFHYSFLDTVTRSTNLDPVYTSLDLELLRWVHGHTFYTDPKEDKLFKFEVLKALQQEGSHEGHPFLPKKLPGESISILKEILPEERIHALMEYLRTRKPYPMDEPLHEELLRHSHEEIRQHVQKQTLTPDVIRNLEWNWREHLSSEDLQETRKLMKEQAEKEIALKTREVPGGSDPTSPAEIEYFYSYLNKSEEIMKDDSFLPKSKESIVEYLRHGIANLKFENREDKAKAFKQWMSTVEAHNRVGGKFHPDLDYITTHLYPEANPERDEILEWLAWRNPKISVAELQKMDRLRASNHLVFTARKSSTASALAKKSSPSIRIAMLKFLLDPSQKNRDALVSLYNTSDQQKIKNNDNTIQGWCDSVKKLETFERVPVAEYLIGTPFPDHSSWISERGGFELIDNFVYTSLKMDPQSRDAQFLRAYLRSIPDYERPATLAFLLSQTGGGSDRLKNTLEFFGTVGKKTGQLASILKLFHTGDESHDKSLLSLEDLKEKARPLDKFEFYQHLDSALKQSGSGESIESIEGVLGSASIKTVAQVKLKSQDAHQAIIVKRPYAKRSVQQNMDRSRRFLEELKSDPTISPTDRQKSLEIGSLLNIVEAELKEELDFKNEIENTRLAGEVYGTSAHPGKCTLKGGVTRNWKLVVPQHLTGTLKSSADHTADGDDRAEVVAMEIATGKSYSEFRKSTDPRDQALVGPIGKWIAEVAVKKLFETGTFNADTHGGNVIVDRDRETLFLIDFGQFEKLSKKRTREYPEDELLDLSKFLYAFANGNSADILKAGIKLSEPSSPLPSQAVIAEAVRTRNSDAFSKLIGKFPFKKQVFGVLKGLAVIRGEKFVSDAEFQTLVSGFVGGQLIRKQPISTVYDSMLQGIRSLSAQPQDCGPK